MLWPRVQGFNLRLQAAAAAAAAPPRPHAAVHVVAPSAWAWRGGAARLPRLRATIDHLLCILPFEPPIMVGCT